MSEGGEGECVCVWVRVSVGVGVGVDCQRRRHLFNELLLVEDGLSRRVLGLRHMHHLHAHEPSDLGALGGGESVCVCVCVCVCMW